MNRTIMRAASALLLTLALVSSSLGAASIWQGSRVPFFDVDGTPMVGATAEFFNCETSTPQVVYADSDLSTPLAQPVEADLRGMFDVVFFSATPGCYRVRVEDADGALIFDDDGIAVSQTADFVPPDEGTTSTELLFRTGMLEPFYGTTAPSGWVRCNARTIGNASSGATERANADTEDLFEHLWTVDATLTVSSGRGGTAAGDFAANKTITLPDCRERNLAGLATMGASDAGLVADAYVDSAEDSSTLGATAGVDDVALTAANNGPHTHTGTTDSSGAHTHTTTASVNSTDGLSDGVIGFRANAASPITSSSSGTHTHTFTTASQGSGTAHNNMAPTMFVTILIKL